MKIKRNYIYAAAVIMLAFAVFYLNYSSIVKCDKNIPKVTAAKAVCFGQ